jgi:hypothetical protein
VGAAEMGHCLPAGSSAFLSDASRCTSTAMIPYLPAPSSDSRAEQVTLFPDEESLVPSLEEMPDAPVPGVEQLRVVRSGARASLGRGAAVRAPERDGRDCP